MSREQACTCHRESSLRSTSICFTVLECQRALATAVQRDAVPILLCQAPLDLALPLQVIVFDALSWNGGALARHEGVIKQLVLQMTSFKDLLVLHERVCLPLPPCSAS